MALNHIAREHTEDRVGGKRRKRAFGRIEPERPALAQCEKARGLIDLAAGENDRRNRACPQAMRLECRRGQDLLAEVRGSVDEYEGREGGGGHITCGYRNARLRSLL